MSHYLRESHRLPPESVAILESKIELLKDALETFDFPHLRSRFQELAGNTDELVEIGREDDGRVFLSIHGIKKKVDKQN